MHRFLQEEVSMTMNLDAEDTEEADWQSWALARDHPNAVIPLFTVYDIEDHTPEPWYSSGKPSTATSLQYIGTYRRAVCAQ